ncbi:MAG: FAD-binding oxidoreductase [Rhodospirillaceae bacterium]|nr:FAD-binding oxidoreductase [Rhodospirillaceae bacterium]
MDTSDNMNASGLSRRLVMGAAAFGAALPFARAEAAEPAAPKITPDQLLAQLRAVLDDKGVLTGDGITGRYLPRRAKEKPLAVLRPTTTAEVSAIMKICNAAKQPIVPQGGNSGLVNATIAKTSEIILSLERMDQIEEVNADNRTMTVGAGVVLMNAQTHAAENGFLLPLDMGSRGEATLGGMVATNAGGYQVVRYGMTRESVLGLEVVLVDGTVVSSMNRMIKNNAGFDLKHIFIGCEGLLGVVTRVVLRLRAEQDNKLTALVAVDHSDGVPLLLRTLERKLGGTMTCFEIMWANYDEFVRKYSPHLLSPLKAGYPYYVIVEATGSDAGSERARFTKVINEVRKDKIIADASIAKDEDARNAIWAMREQAGAAFVELGPFWGYDISLPVGDMAPYGLRVKAEVEAAFPGAHMLIMGHVGDGNLHIVAAPGSRDPAVKKKVDDIVYGAVRDMKGSVSAEHGIGLEKHDYLSWSRSPEEIALMNTLKKTLDPQNLLNPGKLL